MSLSQKENIFNVQDFVEKNLQINFSLDCREETRQKKTQIQHFLSILPKRTEDQNLYKILLNYMIQSESACPGSGKLFLEKFCNKSISKTTQISTKRDLVSFLKERSYSKDVTSVLLETIEILDIDSKISLKKSNSKNLSIEYINSFTFDLHSLVKVNNLEILKPKVVCIDGYIENISEIHHLLTEISEQKIPLLLFCRGMSDDVLHTIKVNNERKTIQVFPYSVQFDIENVNTLVDLANISCCDVISSVKGDLISSIKFSSLGNVDKANISQSSVSLRAKETERLKNHIENLKLTIKDRLEISDILSKRLKSLSSSYLEISIPEGIDFYFKSQELDEGIRIISSFLSNTYTPEKTANFYLSSMTEYLNNLHITKEENEEK